MYTPTPTEHEAQLADSRLSPLHLRIRPSGRTDRERLDQCFRTLSPESSRLRFFATKRALSDKELDFFSGADGGEHIALAAIRLDDQGQELEALGFVRCVRLAPGGPCAEFSITVLDAQQGQGLGTALAEALMQAAQVAGIRQLCFEVLADNMAMRKLARRMGGTPRRMEDGTLEFDCALTPAPAPTPPPEAVAAAPTPASTPPPCNPGWVLPWFADPHDLVEAWFHGIDQTLGLAQRAQTGLLRWWGIPIPVEYTP
ncbi:GNAT family N-acetyltransferase [uncultured Thiodictyon sp.]|uniref:GNAT family N-acetyltransferase n=1 Tax=uncultured Thiodictyon sp. TaxID=1846217 RepID=UPI0025D32801|nr:GNAT family N-acetyltransferase [uncultured Thiodictyon sp.]